MTTSNTSKSLSSQRPSQTFPLQCHILGNPDDSRPPRYEKHTCFQISSTIEQEPPVTPGRVPLSSPSPKVMASSARTTSQPFPTHSCCCPRRLWPSLSSASSRSSISYSLLSFLFCLPFFPFHSLCLPLFLRLLPFVLFLPPFSPPVSFSISLFFFLHPPLPGSNPQKSHSSSDWLTVGIRGVLRYC